MSVLTCQNYYTTDEISKETQSAINACNANIEIIAERDEEIDELYGEIRKLKEENDEIIKETQNTIDGCNGDIEMIEKLGEFLNQRRGEIKKLKEEKDELYGEIKKLNELRRDVAMYLCFDYEYRIDRETIMGWFKLTEKEIYEIGEKGEESEEEEDYEICFDGGEEVMVFKDKKKMKEHFDLLVKDMEEFNKITIASPIKKPYKFCCYGDLEVEDWCWGDSCDFCDKPRCHLVKRDAGYDEWTCKECHKEQYAEEYE